MKFEKQWLKANQMRKILYFLQKQNEQTVLTDCPAVIKEETQRQE